MKPLIKTSWQKEKAQDLPLEVLQNIAANGSFVVIKSDKLFRNFNDKEEKSQSQNQPENLSATEIVNQKIKEVHFKSWMENIAFNLPIIQKSQDISQIQKPNHQTAIIVGAGPSFKANNHLELLKNLEGKTIIATDRMFIPLLKAGIIPNFVMTVDAGSDIALYYQSELANETLPTKAVMAVSIANETIIAFQGKEKFFYTPMFDDIDLTSSVSLAVSYLTKTSILSTGGNVGVNAIYLAFFLGYKNIILTGVDLGYTMETAVEQSAYYPAIQAIDPELTPEKFKRLYMIKGHNPGFNLDFYTDIGWKFQIDNLVAQSENMASKGTNLINSTEGGAVWGGAIKCLPLSKALCDYE